MPALPQETLRVCLTQMTSGRTQAVNIKALETLARRAADAGCDLLALPEVAGLMERDRPALLARICHEGDDPFVQACQALAARHRVWIHLGSTPVQGTDKLRNRSLLFDTTGALQARYDKIHLFDHSPPGRPPVRESDTYEAGNEAVLVDTPWGRWGLAICYDLRFPRLFATFAAHEASLILVPAAFTVRTGQAHWEMLLRARAMATGCWIIAAAQVGHHEDGRRSWGHAMIVDPAGTVIIDAGGDGPTSRIADLDLARLRSDQDRARS